MTPPEGGEKSEVRSQKSEVRSQKSEVRSQKSEVRSGEGKLISYQPTATICFLSIIDGDFNFRRNHENISGGAVAT
jgi:hypothetical protein